MPAIAFNFVCLATLLGVVGAQPGADDEDHLAHDWHSVHDVQPHADCEHPLATGKCPDPVPTGKYRIWFTKTYGDDHVCLTELEFYDETGNRTNATFVSMSSCYGCSSCSNCEHRFGNPQALFDKEATSDDPAAWTCTAPGTFVDGIGSQRVTFTLDAQPKKYVLQRPQVNGNWVTKDFSLEEELNDGNWQLIDYAVDEVKRPDQRRDITMIPQPVIPPPVKKHPPWSYTAEDAWANDYPDCGGKLQTPIELELMDNIGADSKSDAKLPYSYKPVKGRSLINTGTSLQLPGKFGNLTLPNGVYEAKLVNYHAPPEHQFAGAEPMAVGEMRIVHQKIGSKGPEDLAIVVIMLHLPQESKQFSNTEQFFINQALLGIPTTEMYTNPFSNAVDLNVLANSLNGNFWQYTGSLSTPPCTEGVQYFVMETPTLISGLLVTQFKVKFPGNTTSRSIQNSNGRPVFVNKLPAAPKA